MTLGRCCIANGLVFAAMALSLAAAAAQRGAASGRALLISDIHLDPLADPAIVRKLIDAPPARWRAILQRSRLTSFSAYGADTNYPLLAYTLKAAAAQRPFDYVVFNGDALRHNFPQAFVAAGGTAEQFPAFAAKTERFVIQELQRQLKVPVVAALGNDDSPCGDYRVAPLGAFLATAANQLTVLANSPEAKRTFQAGGFFSIAHPTVANEDILDLNTIFWSTAYKSCESGSGNPGEAEMEWLGWKLYNARLLHHHVTLVMHIPPGMDAYNSSHNQCHNPVSFWQPEYLDGFSALMREYSSTVNLVLAGHIHMDDFRIIAAGPDSLPLRITPSVSPIFKNNPAFSVMTYDRMTASVMDITTFFLAPLREAGPAHAGQAKTGVQPSWSKEYQFTSAYDVHAFSAANLSDIAAAIRSGGSARAVYEKNYAASSPSPIDAANFFFYSCAQTHFTAAGYSDCVCNATQSMPETP